MKHIRKRRTFARRPSPISLTSPHREVANRRIQQRTCGVARVNAMYPRQREYMKDSSGSSFPNRTYFIGLRFGFIIMMRRVLSNAARICLVHAGRQGPSFFASSFVPVPGCPGVCRRGIPAELPASASRAGRIFARFASCRARCSAFF